MSNKRSDKCGPLQWTLILVTRKELLVHWCFHLGLFLKPLIQMTLNIDVGESTFFLDNSIFHTSLLLRVKDFVEVANPIGEILAVSTCLC